MYAGIGQGGIPSMLTSPVVIMDSCKTSLDPIHPYADWCYKVCLHRTVLPI